MVHGRFDGLDCFVVDGGNVVQIDAEGFGRQIAMVETLGVFDERGIAVGFHIGENLCDAFVDLRIEGRAVEQRFELFLEIVGILEYDTQFFSKTGGVSAALWDVTVYFSSLM